MWCISGSWIGCRSVGSTRWQQPCVDRRDRGGRSGVRNGGQDFDTVGPRPRCGQFEVALGVGSGPIDDRYRVGLAEFPQPAKVAARRWNQPHFEPGSGRGVGPDELSGDGRCSGFGLLRRQGATFGRREQRQEQCRYGQRSQTSRVFGSVSRCGDALLTSPRQWTLSSTSGLSFPGPQFDPERLAAVGRLEMLRPEPDSLRGVVRGSDPDCRPGQTGVL